MRGSRSKHVHTLYTESETTSNAVGVYARLSRAGGQDTTRTGAETNKRQKRAPFSCSTRTYSANKLLSGLKNYLVHKTRQSPSSNSLGQKQADAFCVYQVQRSSGTSKVMVHPSDDGYVASTVTVRGFDVMTRRRHDNIYMRDVIRRVEWEGGRMHP